jgi:hypothetical protein
VPNVTCGVPPAGLAALDEAMARFHGSTSGLSPKPGERAAPLPERLRGLEERTSGRAESLRRAARAQGNSEEYDTARRWLAVLPPALEAARRAVCRLRPGATSEVLCHADLWPAHVRFEGGSFAGFADFESLAFASPAMDLAQFVGHFGGWRTVGTVLGAYGASARLKEGDIVSLAPEAVADLSAENRKTSDLFVCQSCGYEKNAHTQAAENILARGLAIVEADVDQLTHSPYAGAGCRVGAL